MPTFVCKETGMDCPFEAKAYTQGGLMRKIETHAKNVHKMDPIPPDVLEKIKSVIKS